MDKRVSAAVRARPEQDSAAIAERLLVLARSNYGVHFHPNENVSGRIIFPFAPSQSHGIEDARFVRFVEEGGEATYIATFTAYDGRVILPQMMETRDFVHFNFCTLNGPAVRNKGMALFPRRVGGYYCMLSRQDNENIHIMFSDHLHFWFESKVIVRPREAWEFVQLGNCGSPIETPAGWIVLIHGVGPMRKYCISAILLDLKDPTRVIGRLREPLIKPTYEEREGSSGNFGGRTGVREAPGIKSATVDSRHKPLNACLEGACVGDRLAQHDPEGMRYPLESANNQREGYVPNVVYTCGAILHGKRLIIPYAVSDSSTVFATVLVDDLLEAMQENPA